MQAAEIMTVKQLAVYCIKSDSMQVTFAMYQFSFNINFTPTSALVFPQELIHGKSCNPGILQHPVTFYSKSSCQVSYS